MRQIARETGITQAAIYHHLEAGKLSSLLEGTSAKHQDPGVLAQHITTLLLSGVRGK